MKIDSRQHLHLYNQTAQPGIIRKKKKEQDEEKRLTKYKQANQSIKTTTMKIEC